MFKKYIYFKNIMLAETLRETYELHVVNSTKNKKMNLLS